MLTKASYIAGSDERAYIWRKRNTELDPKNLRATFKHGGGSVFLWGCISVAEVGRFHRRYYGQKQIPQHIEE